MHWPVVGQLSVFFFVPKKGFNNLSEAGWMEVFFYERMSKCWTPTESRGCYLEMEQEKTSELIFKKAKPISALCQVWEELEAVFE